MHPAMMLLSLSLCFASLGDPHTSQPCGEPVSSRTTRLEALQVANKSDDCAALLDRINEALTISKLTPEDAARVEALRDEGAASHRAGRCNECIEPLRQAALLLGIEVPR
jgi:hypothetical protein